MALHGLQSRIVVWFVLLLVTVQGATFFMVNVAGTRTARDTLAEELVTGRRVFDRVLEQKAAQLAQGARILSSDFAFREAIGTKDRGTIDSVIANHGDRIHADRMMLIDLDRRVVADTRGSGMSGKAFAHASMVAEAERAGEASAIVSLDGALYQLVVVPVLAPIPIAWVAMGFRVDDKVAQDLKNLIGLEVAFFTHRADGWQAEAATLRRRSSGIVEALSATGAEPVAPFTVALDGVDHMTLFAKPPVAHGAPVIAVLQRSLDDALEPFERLQRNLIAFTSVAILIAIGCSHLIARGIARPVQRLAAFARRIAAGDYRQSLDIQREDEIGELAIAFEHMREGLTERESRILHLAYRDALTGLPNRTLFNDRLSQAIHAARRLGRPLTILMMDLDRFKDVNDSLGHRLGDLLLVEVGRRLESIFSREVDTIARMGGDEFAVLLPTESAAHVTHLVREVLDALEAPMTLEGHLVDTRASIGIATFPEHGDDLMTLLRHADSAMYLAKRGKTGFAIYDPRFDSDSIERLSLMTELRRAVEEDELILYYQPKRELAAPAVAYVEALVRWKHATRGFMAPDLFIPFAEQTGYITAITGWVLRNALIQLREWRSGGLQMHMAINISARDLMNATFPTQVATMLATHGCEASWILFEITETSILDDPGSARETLDRLHRLGCKIAIDDFGTGYSSLAYLKRLPVDELKIDKSFVMGMVDDANDAAIVRSTIELGHNLGLKVVAEGVESEAILDRLTSMGCDMVQGYLLSKPLPADELERWMRRTNASCPAPRAAVLEAA